MRLLFFMSHPGFTRNYESTLRELARRGHDVEVVFDRGKDTLADLYAPIERLSVELPQITHSAAPWQRRSNAYEIASRLLRTSVDYSRYLEPEFASATKLRQRVGNQTPRAVKSLLALPPLNSRRGRAAFRHFVVAVDRSAPLHPEVLALLQDRRPDLVLITPLLEMGSPQLDYLRAAKALGLPTVLCVASWDNLTSKGLIQEVPDLVTVWNDAQRREAVELHSVPSHRVAITGAVAYDHWFGWRPSTTWREFSAEVGLREDRPMILYVGSSGFIAPDETAHIRRVIEALRTSGRQELAELGVLVRPHPTNPLPDVESLEELDQVKVWPRTGQNPTDVASRNAYFDSMHHARAVVGINTSALIESAIVGRPVLSMLASENRETQQGTPHFQHLLHENGGPLAVARDMSSHIEDIAQVVTAHDHAGYAGFLQDFVRPGGLETRAAVHMADVLEQCSARAARTPHPHEAGRALTAVVRLIGLLARLRRDRGRSRSRRNKIVHLLLRSQRSRTFAYTRVRPRLLAAARTIARAADAGGEPPVISAPRPVAPTKPQQRPTTAPTPSIESHDGGPVVAGPWTGSLASELLEWVPYLQERCQAEPGLAERLIVVTLGTPAEWYELSGARVVDVSTLAVVPQEISSGRWTTGGRYDAGWVTTSEAAASLRALACDALGVEAPRVLDQEEAADGVVAARPGAAAAPDRVPPTGTVCVRLVANDVVRRSQAAQDLAVRVLLALAPQRHMTVLADDFGAVARAVRVDPALEQRIQEQLGLSERDQVAASASAGALVSTFDGVCVAAARRGATTVGLVESLHLLPAETLAAIKRSGDLPLSIVDGPSVQLLAPASDALDAAS